MRGIGAFEAQNTLGSLLDDVERLVPADGMVDRETARTATAQMRAMRRGVTLGDISIKSLIDEGRR